MKRFRIYLLLLLASCLSSCSWNEYFVIFNTTGSSVEVSYEIDSSDKGFPHYLMRRFGLIKPIRNNEIDWNNPVAIG